MNKGPPLEVFKIFLKLGLTCFGGPVAHIGYFRDEFVVKRGWLGEDAYADLVALCQFLPGPASSQVGFSIGMMRAGYWGGLAAWAGFTLPSAIFLAAFAYGAGSLSGPAGIGLLHGLKLTAVAIVAQAVFAMARTLCPDRGRATIATASAVIIAISPSFIGQIGAIVVGGLAGLMLYRSATEASSGRIDIPVSRRVGWAALGLLLVLLIGLPGLSGLTRSGYLAAFDAFYRSGVLVFGGGHVVLPLLHDAFVASGWLSEDAFIVGYGAAQAVPGPLFTFAAYLGAVIFPATYGIAGAVLGLTGIFLPGMLILIAVLPFWDQFRRSNRAQSTMRGVNAAVVGLLGAALYDPIWTSSIHSPRDFAVALIGFVLLIVWRVPPLVVVAFSAAAGIAAALA